MQVARKVGIAVVGIAGLAAVLYAYRLVSRAEPLGPPMPFDAEARKAAVHAPLPQHAPDQEPLGRSRIGSAVSCMTDGGLRVAHAAFYPWTGAEVALVGPTPICIADEAGVATFAPQLVMQRPTVFCFAPGFVPEPLNWESEAVVLTKACSVDVSVHDPKGAPIGGARVIAVTSLADREQRFAASDMLVPTPHAGAMVSGVTDASGRCTLCELRPRCYQIVVEHEHMVLMTINGGSPGAQVSMPMKQMDIAMARVLGRHLVLSEDIVTSASVVPSGLTTGLPGLMPLIAGSSLPQSASGKELEFYAALTGTGGDYDTHPMLYVYAVLSRSGPTRIAVPLIDIGAPDFRLHYETATDERAGMMQDVRVVVTDARGAECPIGLRWRTDSGVNFWDASDEAKSGTLEPREIRWEGAVKAGAPSRLPVGRVAISTLDPFLRHGLEAASIDVGGANSSVLQLRLPWVVARVEVVSGSESWRLHVEGATLGGIEDSRSYVLSERSVALQLPSGEYRLVATRPGCHSIERCVSVADREQLVDLGPFERSQVR